jgi:hypothetical protein
MKIIIYATHSFGTYETLKSHPDIVVLGFGTKWNGFIEKAKVIQDYLNTLPDNEIVVILDGFDSYIKKTDGLREEFDKMNCKVLVSLSSKTLPTIIDKYVSTRVFGYCRENYTANSGLMMGYVDYLKKIWSVIIDGPSNDDQRNLNLACKELPFLKIDIHNTIFQNCYSVKEMNESSAYFCQIPGTMSVHRLTRGIYEYAEYFIPEIIAICIAFLYLFNRIFVHRFIYKISKTARSYLNKRR